jgi:CheY-like chemotaxis protein
MTPKPLSILLADDDTEDLQILEDAILYINPNAQVKYVLNGKEVINFLDNCSETELPCLIILDYNMPLMTGAQVLNLLGNHIRYQSIPKLVLSTSSTEAHKNQCMNNGAIGYFVKPDNIIELQTLAKKMIGFCNYN